MLCWSGSAINLLLKGEYADDNIIQIPSSFNVIHAVTQARILPQSIDGWVENI